MTPAAVLSILVKTQGVAGAAGDLRSLDKAGKSTAGNLKTVGDHAKRSSGSLKILGTAAKGSAALLGGIGLAKALGSVNEEYREAQKVGAQTNAVIKSTGGAAKVSQKHVENLAGAISKKVGIDDEAIQSSENMLLTFTKVRNEAGKGNKIFDQATRTVTDMSVALGQSAKSSAIQLGKALSDPVKGATALRRVGVTLDDQQKKMIETFVKSGNTMGAQKIILGELNKEFGGSAAAQATAGDKMRVALGNLAEAAGGILVPQLDKAAVFFTKLINDFVEGKGIATVIIPVFFKVRDSLASIVSAIRNVVAGFKQGKVWAVALVAALAGLSAAVVVVKAVTTATKAWTAATRAMAAAQVALDVAMDANPIMLAVAALAGLAAAIFIAYKKIKPFRDAVDATWAAIKSGVSSAINFVKQHWMLLLAILTGPFGPAVVAIVRHFGAITKAAGKLPGQIADAIKSAPRTILNAGIALGEGIATGVVQGLGHLGHLIFEKFKEAAGWVKGKIGGVFSGIGRIVGLGSGDGIGKGLAGGALPSGGAFGGSLKGANSALRPFAAIGSRFGLSVSSGRRPGSITSSGNVSYHSSGEAIDMWDGRGPDSNKMAFFRYMKSHFGGRLAELIYGPGQVGIKNGQPYNFGSALNAQHMDHVHVAFDTGRPGVGDGIGRRNMLGMMGDGLGKFSATSYGPPWGGIQGTGVTATGVNLKGGPHRYGVAVDPSVIPLGSKLKISPNPFGYSGAFTAFDTGGAIKGNRIDFYDWRGRAAQNGWGRRTVSIQTVGNAIKKAAKKPKSGHATVGGGVRQPVANAPSEAIQAFLRGTRPLKGGGPNKGYTESQRPPSVVSDTGEDPNQALIDSNNELIASNQQRIDLETTLASNQLKILALAGQGDQLIASVIAAVNGGLGRTIGLGQAGLRSPAGAVTRQ